MMTGSECESIGNCSTRRTVVKYNMNIDNLPCAGNYTECPTHIHKTKLLLESYKLEEAVVVELENRNIKI